MPYKVTACGPDETGGIVVNVYDKAKSCNMGSIDMGSAESDTVRLIAQQVAGLLGRFGHSVIVTVETKQAMSFHADQT